MRRQRVAVTPRPKGKRAAVRAEEERRLAKARARELRGKVLVNSDNLRPSNSYGTPDFVVRGFYEDKPFSCTACGAAQVWRATQQKWWYESAKGDVWTTAVLCRPCRARERARKAAARAVHQEGLAKKQRET